MKPQKILNCQSNLEKKEQRRRYDIPKLQTMLSSYCNQDSMIVAQKQAHRQMEQNREPRSKPTLLWSISLQHRRTEYTMRKSLFLGNWISCDFLHRRKKKAVPSARHVSSSSRIWYGSWILYSPLGPYINSQALKMVKQWEFWVGSLMIMGFLHQSCTAYLHITYM